MQSNLALKVARLTARITQAELAAHIGQTENKVCRYETGRAWPSVDTQERIASVLRSSVKHLFNNREVHHVR